MTNPLSQGIHSTLQEFPWPRPPGATSDPVWTGQGFRVGEKTVPYLADDVADAGWDDDLAQILIHETDDNKPLGRASLRMMVDCLSQYIGEAGSNELIMEIGCGIGTTLKALQSSFPHAGLIGTEYASAALESLSGAVSNVPLVQLDLQKPAVPDESVSAIVMLNVLEHIEDDHNAMRGVSRLLKPGGIVHVEVPAGPELFDGFDDAAGHFRRYDLGGLHAVLREAGFGVLETRRLGVLVYPAFWLTKKRSRLRPVDPVRRRAQLSRSISRAQSSVILDWSLRLDRRLPSALTPKWGIRLVVTARKEA